MITSSKEDGAHPVDRHVNRRVREKRISLGHNQSDLGCALGLAFQQVQKYEKGANRISASKLWDIPQFFNVDIGYFFEGLEAATSAGRDDQNAAAPSSSANRNSVEIARLAPKLSPNHQKLALELLRELGDKPGPQERCLTMGAFCADPVRHCRFRLS